MDGYQVATYNGEPIPIQIVGSSTFGIYEKISGRKTYNMFESDGWLISYPGWKRVIELESSTGQRVEGRGFFRSIRGNLVVAVVNSGVWSLDQQIGASFIGNLATSSGPVFMDENLNGQIGIVDQLNLYIYNRFTNSLTLQTGLVFENLTPNYICFHNTYFLIGNGNTTSNGAQWFAFEFASDTTVDVAIGGELALETKPDYARAIVRLSEKGNNVLVFGTAVTEIQNNSPIVNRQTNQVILYQRVSTINIDYGVLSVATIASSDNFVVWLAINEKSPPVIMYFDGQQARTLSSDGINYQLQRLNHPEQSVGFIYKTDGHLFYQITFYNPNDNLSLIYDFTTQKFYHVSDHELNYHPARQVVYIGNSTYFISLNNGSVYQIGSQFTSYDENIARVGGAHYNQDRNYIIPRQVIGDTWMIPNSRPDPFRANVFYLTMEQGADLTWSELSATTGCDDQIITEEGEDVITEGGEDVITEDAIGCFNYQPNVDFSFSPDGAVTYSNEVRNVLDYTAHRKNITQWERLGRMNQFTPRLKFWGYGRFVVGNAILVIIR